MVYHLHVEILMYQLVCDNVVCNGRENYCSAVRYVILIRIISKMYESDDEEDLVSNIIRVFVAAKDGIQEISQRVRRKSKVPEILVTDYSEYDLKKDFCEEPVFEETTKFTDNQISHTIKHNQFLNTGNEFEAEPTDLMPESFLSFLAGCKNLIGDVSNYKEERITADDWIEHFDAKLKEALEEEHRLEAYERNKLIKLEERRRRLEERRKIRKINKPLMNLHPRNLSLSSRSCHDNVCLQTLVDIKKNLRKYQPLIKSRRMLPFKNLQAPLKCNLDIVKLLNQSFSDFIDMEMDRIINCTNLRINGIVLKKKELYKKDQDANINEIKHESTDITLENALNVSLKVKHIKNPKMTWEFNQKSGVLHTKSTYAEDILKNTKFDYSNAIKISNEAVFKINSKKDIYRNRIIDVSLKRDENENKGKERSCRMENRNKKENDSFSNIKVKNEPYHEIAEQQRQTSFQNINHIHFFSTQKSLEFKKFRNSQSRIILQLPVNIFKSIHSSVMDGI